MRRHAQKRSNEHLTSITEGMDAFSRRVEEKKKVYARVLRAAAKQGSGAHDAIFRIRDHTLFKATLKTFGAALDQSKAQVDLRLIYDIGLHRETGALIVANRGATLYSLSPRSQTPYLTRHIGCCVYMPGLGVEFVNVGLVGDVYKGPTVLRTESACSPSFLFGSQRCNCAHQWDSIRELAARFNKVTAPAITGGKAFERWVQRQCTYREGKHLFRNPGQGFVLLHVDTQNGMGSGYSKGEFTFDLYTRASMRHRGEYSSEQTAKTSMAGGFYAIGLRPDPRQENGHKGYQITRVILDYLKTSERIIFLTNNPHKMRSLYANGYKITRVKTLGTVNVAGSQEAYERGVEFDHFDIDSSQVTFAQEQRRLIREIGRHHRDGAADAARMEV